MSERAARLSLDQQRPAMLRFSPAGEVVRASPRQIGVQRKSACACGGGCPRCRANDHGSTYAISTPGDRYEQEADRVAGQVMRMPDPHAVPSIGSGPRLLQRARAACENAGAGNDDGEEIQAKEEPGATPRMSHDVQGRIDSLRGGGDPLPASAREFFEPRFGRDFGDVRVHSGAAAAETARSVSALAYTIGSDIVFGSGQYAPETAAGRHLLAHELTHVIQQSEQPTLRRTIQRGTIAAFRADLEAISPDHATVIAELFSHPSFIPLANYLDRCPAGTIDFNVRRHRELVRGRLVDLFGGFNPGSPGEMIVNPFRREHRDNPLEVVDTIVHEFIHAILDLNSVCTGRTNPFPLPATILDAHHDPELTTAMSTGDPLERRGASALAAGGTTTTSGGNLVEHMQDQYGPSASRPETHYVDLNRAGEVFVTSIISDIHRTHPTIGQETVSFDNVELTAAAPLLATRPWLNASQERFSISLHKDRVAAKRKVEPATFTDREYHISAIQVVESADSRVFDPNTAGGWGPVGGVWQCEKRSRFTGRTLRTYVTGIAGSPPGGSVGYSIVQHT